MGLDDARHLLNRAGFGASISQLELYAALAPDQAIYRLVSAPSTSQLPWPTWTTEPIESTISRIRQDIEIRRETRQINKERRIELQQWQIQNVWTTPHPLAERMVLFWHDVFFVPITAVLDPLLYAQHMRTMREHATGNYGDLLRAMMRDVALLEYYDAPRSRLSSPNARLAEALLDRFSMGDSVPRRRDYRELARALTGASMDRGTFTYRFDLDIHDPGDKNIFGRSGAFTPDEAIQLVLDHPATAENIVRRLWRHLVGPHPEAKIVDKLAKDFRRDYELQPLLVAILAHPQFWAQAQRGQLVKSPLDVLVSALKLFDQPLLNLGEVFEVASTMEMPMFDGTYPRHSGLSWIRPDLWSLRMRIMRRLSRGKEVSTEHRGLALYHWIEQGGELETAMLPTPTNEPPMHWNQSAYERLGHYLLDRQFQLK